jgi:hypothetical protein
VFCLFSVFSEKKDFLIGAQFFQHLFHIDDTGEFDIDGLVRDGVQENMVPFNWRVSA